MGYRIDGPKYHFGKRECKVCRTEDFITYVMAERRSRSGKLLPYTAFSGCLGCARQFVAKRKAKV